MLHFFQGFSSISLVSFQYFLKQFSAEIPISRDQILCIVALSFNINSFSSYFVSFILQALKYNICSAPSSTIIGAKKGQNGIRSNCVTFYQIIYVIESRIKLCFYKLCFYKLCFYKLQSMNDVVLELTKYTKWYFRRTIFSESCIYVNCK